VGLLFVFRIGAVLVDPCEKEGDSGPILDVGLLSCEFGIVDSLFNQVGRRDDIDSFLPPVDSPTKPGASELPYLECLNPVFRLPIEERVSEVGRSGFENGEESEGH